MELLNFFILAMNIWISVSTWRSADKFFEVGQDFVGWVSVFISALAAASALDMIL